MVPGPLKVIIIPLYTHLFYTMKRIHKILTVLICSGILTPCHAAESSRYNIVLLFADDISAREFPVYESTVWTPPWAFGNDTSEQRFRAETPVINKLAHEGAFVRTAWANAVCSPSRATIMTGRYGHLHKWWQNNDVGKHRDENGKLVDWPIYMSSPLTLAQVAKQGGYNTYWTGKTQMKVSDEELQNFGFDCILNTPGAPANSPTDFYYYQGIDPQSGTKAWLSKDTGLPPAWKAGNQMVWSETSFFWQPAVSYMSYENSKWRVQGWPISRQDREHYGLHTFGPDVELGYSFKFIERSVNEGKPFFIYHTSHLGHGAHNYLRQKSLKGNERVYYPGTPKISWDGSQYHRTEPKITGDMGEYDTHGTVTEPGIHHHINYLYYQV